MKYLTMSVVIPTYNSEKTLGLLLRSIRGQNYPQDKIEIILSDGGSTDSTKNLAHKYNAKIIFVTPKNKQSAEYNRAFGAHKGRGELLAFFDHDNVLPHRKILEKMTIPLISNKDIVGVETLYYHYDKSFSILDRYFALFGVNDPLPYYLGKADRQSYIFKDGYHLAGSAKDMGEYFIVQFTTDKIPTLGSNGFVIRRNTLMENAKVDLDHFFHIDVNVDLIRKGFRTYAFIKDSITHLSNHNDFISYLHRRKLYMREYHLSFKEKRRYSVFEKKDTLGLIYFILISVTFIKPLFDSVRGFLKVRDIAWFLHPIMCFGTVIVYGYTFLFRFNKIK